MRKRLFKAHSLRCFNRATAGVSLERYTTPNPFTHPPLIETEHPALVNANNTTTMVCVSDFDVTSKWRQRQRGNLLFL